MAAEAVLEAVPIVVAQPLFLLTEGLQISLNRCFPLACKLLDQSLGSLLSLARLLGGSFHFVTILSYLECRNRGIGWGSG